MSSGSDNTGSGNTGSGGAGSDSIGSDTIGSDGVGFGSLRVLAAALIALALNDLIWFRADDDRIASWIVFALPPLFLAYRCLRGRGRARFWSGVLALCWFAHGVMVAWSRPAERHHALIAIALSLVVIFSANADGLRARFAKPRK